VTATFPAARGGPSCFIDVALLGDPGGLGPQGSTTLSPQGNPGIEFSKVPTSQQAAFMGAIEAGPSVWAVTSVDEVSQFHTRRAPDANVALLVADDYVLGITPHDPSVPGCHAISAGP
jgi:hypothetical protein